VHLDGLSTRFWTAPAAADQRGPMGYRAFRPWNSRSRWSLRPEARKNSLNGWGELRKVGEVGSSRTPVKFAVGSCELNGKVPNSVAVLLSPWLQIATVATRQVAIRARWFTCARSWYIYSITTKPTEIID
jgi:hypothetical protein